MKKLLIIVLLLLLGCNKYNHNYVFEVIYSSGEIDTIFTNYIGNVENVKCKIFYSSNEGWDSVALPSVLKLYGKTIFDPEIEVARYVRSYRVLKYDGYLLNKEVAK